MNTYASVYNLVKKIPPGKVTTYGLIAVKLKSTNKNINAHVVGWILHKNNSTDVPCHRVVDRNGRLAPNFAFNGAKEQKIRLEIEGVKFIDEMHVDLKNHLRPNMDVVIQGFLFGIALNAPMGPTNVEVIRRGIAQGWKASVLFVLGNMTVFCLYFILIIFGFSFLSQSKLFNTILLAFGVIVLLYLSYDALNDFRQKKEIDLAEKKNDKDNFISGILLSFGNPALFLILIGLIGADLSNNALSLSRGFLLGLGMILSYIIFFTGFIIVV